MSGILGCWFHLTVTAEEKEEGDAWRCMFVGKKNTKTG